VACFVIGATGFYIFSLGLRYLNGERRYGAVCQPEFFLGNQNVEAHWVLPYFPTKAKFKTGVKARAKYRAQTKKNTEQALKQQLKQE
jgi:hypothetical protein